MHIRTFLFAVIFLFCGNSVSGQHMVKSFRSLDDNRALREDYDSNTFPGKLKAMPLSQVNSDRNFSLGGEIRQQVRFFDNINFGDVSAGRSDRDVYWLQRYMVHADLNISRKFRLFAQFNSSHVVGKDKMIPGIDRDDLGMMQAFLDVRLGSALLFRIGRQDISYGSQFMISTREGPNTRQTYDGIFTSVQLGMVKGDAFVLSPVETNALVFDNKINKNFLIYGGYLTLNGRGTNVQELYYFGTECSALNYETPDIKENRHSFGIRLSNNGRNFLYTAEVTGQTGKLDNLKIRAWQIDGAVGYAWNQLPLHPAMGFEDHILSGDAAGDDGMSNTFRPISARPPVTYIVPIGPANIMVIIPNGRINLSEALSFSAKYYCVWRLSPEDGIYSLDMNSMIRAATPSDTGKMDLFCQGIGSDIVLEPNQNFYFALNFGMFFPGNYVRSSGAGQNIIALVLRATYWF